MNYKLSSKPMWDIEDRVLNATLDEIKDTARIGIVSGPIQNDTNDVIVVITWNITTGVTLSSTRQFVHEL